MVNGQLLTAADRSKKNPKVRILFLFNRDCFSCRCLASPGQGELVTTDYTNVSSEWQCAQEDVLVAPGGTPHGGLVLWLPRDDQR